MKLKRILAVVLAVAAIGTVTVTALAASDGSESETGTARAAWGGGNLNLLDKLLEDGILSQATYDNMKAYVAENMPQNVELPERSERVNILDTLLEAEIITQAEYDAMKAAMPASGEKPDIERPASGERPALSGERQKVNLFDSFVENGTISEETATAIQEYLKANMPERPELKENTEGRTDIFSNMLEADVITQAEYDAIKAAMPERTALSRRGGQSAD